MRVKSEKPNRSSLRLPFYDYTQPGAFFITVCTHCREPILGKTVDGNGCLNAYGQIVQEEWQRTAQIRPNLMIDAFIVMPNHIHGIIIIHHQSRGTMHRAPTPQLERFGHPTSNSIPTIIRGFKSAVTQRVNQLRGTPYSPVWQRNYYEHVIRNEADLEEICEYIANNPLKWLEDENHPVNIRRS
jgi:putative transposase